MIGRLSAGPSLGGPQTEGALGVQPCIVGSGPAPLLAEVLVGVLREQGIVGRVRRLAVWKEEAQWRMAGERKRDSWPAAARDNRKRTKRG